MTVAVGASGKCWRYYKSGVLSSRHKCPTRINHGVVVVGLVKAEEKPDEEKQYEKKCRKATKAERKDK